jgi:hypothetical protein
MIKEYWFLITVAISGVVSVAYMIIFQVTPWDKQREVKYRRKLVEFHNLAGFSLLEGGYFTLASAEFKAALKLNATNQRALGGQYLSGLFLAFDAPDWDASAGFAVQHELAKLVKQQELSHIVEKYLGDLHYSTNQLGEARSHYEAALSRKPGYPDALSTLGWFHYNVVPDLDRMAGYFLTLTLSSPYDWRGFHGLGYALYMKGLKEQDPDKRKELIVGAARQSDKAKDLSVNRWSIMADFGEVARSVNPQLSLYFHEVSSKLLEDPKLKKVNPASLDAKLLMSTDITVRIETRDQKRAWITYQLALDYLASHRLASRRDGEEQHRLLVEKAGSFDEGKEIYPIYADQLAILDLLLPAAVLKTDATV